MDQATIVDRVALRGLDRVEGQSKVSQAEVRGQVAVQALDLGEGQSKVNQAEVRDRLAVQALDGAGVRDLAAGRARALAGRVAGSVPTDALMLTRPRRPSRNRKFHQKRRRVLRNLDRPKKMLRSKRVFPNNDGSRQRGCFLWTNGHGWKRAVTVCVQMRETDSSPIPLLQLLSEYDLA